MHLPHIFHEVETNLRKTRIGDFLYRTFAIVGDECVDAAEAEEPEIKPLAKLYRRLHDMTRAERHEEAEAIYKRVRKAALAGAVAAAEREVAELEKAD